MPTYDEAEHVIHRAREAFLVKYANNPKIAFDSCYCIVVYQMDKPVVLGGEKSDDLIVDVYACPLHRDDDKKLSCKKARDDCRKFNYKFSIAGHDLTEDEIVIIGNEKEANREKCRQLKSLEILEKLR